jgi:hypothetical protein
VSRKFFAVAWEPILDWAKPLQPLPKRQSCAAGQKALDFSVPMGRIVAAKQRLSLSFI